MSWSNMRLQQLNLVDLAKDTMHRGEPFDYYGAATGSSVDWKEIEGSEERTT